jgi:predicted acyltransferase
VLQIRGWARPFVIYGVNPLIAFAGSGIMARLTDSILKTDVGGRNISWHQASYEWLFKPYFPAKFASLLWALAFVTLWLGILTVLYRRKVIVRL